MQNGLYKFMNIIVKKIKNKYLMKNKKLNYINRRKIKKS